MTASQLFKKKKPKEVILEPVHIGVHSVKGSMDGIEFLKNASFKYVESLFWFAKRYKKSEFIYDGVMYVLERKEDVTYEVRRKTAEDVEFVKGFK